MGMINPALITSEPIERLANFLTRLNARKMIKLSPDEVRTYFCPDWGEVRQRFLIKLNLTCWFGITCFPKSGFFMYK